MYSFEDQSGDLCSGCRSIPLDDYFGGSPDPGTRELGYFQEILSRKDCPLCRLVTQAIHSHLSSHWEPGKYPNQMCYLDQRRTRSSSSMLEVWFNVTTESMPEHSFGTYTDIGCIIDLGATAPQDDHWQKDVPLVRLSSDSLNYRLVRSWLQDCEHNHGQRCNWTEGARADGMDLWLVDVQNMCLVKRSWDCRYVALSYVWGQVTTFRTEKSNIPALLCPGSLDSFLHAIPQVIKDAIQFVEKIKEQYLWVDALCIIQDDEDFKTRYIPQMHRIYETALVTLISITGEDANTGLPGISDARFTPNLPVKLGRRMLVARLPTLRALKSGSKWSTRAWTFQEEIFSRRRIFFTNYQLYLMCASNRTAESGMEYTHERMDLWSAKFLEPGGIAEDATSKFNFYVNFVKGYSNRTLSFHSDSLTAFAGILSKLRESVGMEFASALPEASFDLALHWVQPFAGLLRPRHAPGQASQTLVCRSPTWCWTAWDGFVFWDPWRLGYFMGKAISMKLEVKGYWINDGRGVRKIRSSYTNGPESDNSVSFGKAQVEMLCENIPMGALLFNAKAVSGGAFTISSPTLDSPNPECRKPYSRYFRNLASRAGWIYDMAGHHCGTLRGIDFRKLTDRDKSRWQLVLLSRCDQDFVTQGDIDECPEADRPPEYPSSEEYYEQIFDTERYRYKRWWARNVMLIDWKGAWAERVAIGQIHVDAWEAAEPKMEAIVLG